MTFSNELKRAKIGNKTLVATENYDKFSDVPYYQVYIVPENGLVHTGNIYTCGKTTWRKKFAELVNAYYYRIAESVFDCGCDSCECEQVAHDIKCGLDTVEHWVNRAIAYYAVLGNDASDINSTVRRYVADIAKRHV